jgi:hypothetical protein
MNGSCHADSVEDAKNRAVVASVTDVLTTVVGLSQGGRDYNPLIGSNQAMLIPIAALKYYLIDSIVSSNDTDANKKFKLNIIASLYGGASVNNFLVLAGITSPASLIIGAVSGYMMYEKFSENIDK